MRVKVEVCVTSVAEAEAAAELGADTVELCTWLACGGVTPSSGLVDAVRGAVRIPVRVLVRPGPSGFRYEPSELSALLVDAEVFGGGAIGLVTGALDAEGMPDARVMAAVIRAAPESEITFHRAIDRARDMPGAVERCVELGIHRVLSSGGSSLALDGSAMLKRIVACAENRLVIAAAGGINSDNVVELVERTGVVEVHFAAQRALAAVPTGASMSSSHQGVSFASEPDRSKIEGVLNALVKAGLR